MRQRLNTTMKAKVLIPTARTLTRQAEETGLTTGEVLDRLILRASPKDPELASLLMADLILTTCARLDNEQFNEAIDRVADLLLEATDGEAGGNRARYELLVRAYSTEGKTE